MNIIDETMQKDIIVGIVLLIIAFIANAIIREIKKKQNAILGTLKKHAFTVFQILTIITPLFLLFYRYSISKTIDSALISSIIFNFTTLFMNFSIYLLFRFRRLEARNKQVNEQLKEMIEHYNEIQKKVNQ